MKAKRTEEIIKFEKEDMVELMWHRTFQGRQLLLINLQSTDFKTLGKGRLVIYDRELKVELAKYEAATIINLMELSCPDVRPKEQEIKLANGRTLSRTIEQRFYLANAVQPLKQKEESKARENPSHYQSFFKSTRNVT